MLFVAFDPGPRQALRPIALATGNDVFKPCQRLDISNVAAWTDLMRRQKTRLLVCGTSCSSLGKVCESGARLAATQLGVPIVCIEDSPGNYSALDASETALLIVESEFSAALHHGRPHAPNRIVVTPAPRYDALRHPGWKPKPRCRSGLVLWAGQPETWSCVITLHFIAPHLETLGASLLFRAHPRDEGYPKGEYEKLLRNYSHVWTDVTSMGLEELFRYPIALVMTQFSSLADEACFRGIPALNILLPDAGGGLLKQQKGFSTLPSCVEKAAFCIHKESEFETLAVALNDEDARQEVLANFAGFHDPYTRSTPTVVCLLESVCLRNLRRMEMS